MRAAVLALAACAAGPRPTIAGAELYARLAALEEHGRVELEGSDAKRVVVRYGQVLVTEDARQMFALDALVSTCTGRPADEPETCNLVAYRDRRFRVYDDAPVKLASTAEPVADDGHEGRVLAVFLVIAAPLSYGIATCEFKGCELVFGIALGLDVLIAALVW